MFFLRRQRVQLTTKYW